MPAVEPDWWLELAEFEDELEAAAQSERPDFICSVTNEIMRHPAMLVDGEESLHTYEYNALINWFFDEGRNTDPRTNREIEPSRRSFIRDNRLQREIRSWCEDKVRAWREELAAQPDAGAAIRSSVHLFVDHSNVAVDAKNATGKELNVRRLVHCVERRRDAKERVVVGSDELERTRAQWRNLDYFVLTEKGSGKEQLVDNALHAHLMRTAGKTFEPGRVLALVTGDGGPNHGSTTFPECISAALQNDWHIELYSWGRKLNQVYVDMAEQHASHVSIHRLEEIYK